MSDTSLTRVHYFERQFLGAQDFEAEQQYHLAMRRRHNIALHTWGIAAGLELRSDADGLWVLPGMAIDGYGREIILQTKWPIDPRAFDDKGSDTLDVQIEYQLLDSDPRSQRFQSCESDDATSFYRWQEQPLVRLMRPNPNNRDRRKPATVPPGDLDFAPFSAPPDDPQRDWPLFLGQVRREQQKPGQPYTYSLSHADRPYVGLVGARVVAPSRLAWLQLGEEAADSNRRFGVFVRNAPSPTATTSSETPALEIDRDGAIDLRGATTAHGTLTMDKSAIAFRGGAPAAAERTAQMYYILDKISPPPSAAAQSGVQQNAPEERHELRIEVPPGVQNKVVIGAWSAETDPPGFQPFLTIGAVKDNDGNDLPQITVHGDLVVRGDLKETRQRAESPLTDPARNLIFASALTTVNALVPGAGPPRGAETDFDVLKRVLTTDGGRMIVGETLEGTAGHLEVFVAQLAARPVAAQAMITGLLAATNPAVMQVLVQEVQQSSKLPTFAPAVIASDAAIPTVTEQLLLEDNKGRLTQVQTGVLKAEAGRNAVFAALDSVPAQERTAFVRSALTNEKATRALVGDAQSRRSAAELLTGDEDGARAIVAAAVKLWKANQGDITKLKLVDPLKRASKEFRAALRQALEDEPTPTPPAPPTPPTPPVNPGG